MLRSACSGVWHHARFKRWDFCTLLEKSKTVKYEIGAHLWHSGLRGKAHTLEMENLDARLEWTKPHLPCPGNISKRQAVEELKYKCSSLE